MKKCIVLCCILLTVSFQGCIIIKELMPKKCTVAISPERIVPVERTAMLNDDDVTLEYFYVKGYQEPHTPGEAEPTDRLRDFLLDMHGDYDLNRSGIIRLYEKDTQPDKIIIMAPGLYSGGATLVNLGLSIKKRLKSDEVWIWERRSNLLEDRRLVLQALKDKDTSVLYNHLHPDRLALKDTVFYQPSTRDIGFVGYWGLNVLMRDLYEVVMEAKKRSREVVLVGYSLGVLYVTSFLADDFSDYPGGVPGRALVDRVILLDGPPRLNGYVKSEFIYKKGTYLFPNNPIEGIERLESGSVYPCSGSADRDLSFFLMTDIKGVFAYLDPDGISIEPFKVGGKQLPITNLARYLVEFDDNYNWFKLFTATFGRADAEHSGKFSRSSTVKITGLSEGKDVIGWLPGDHESNVEYNDYYQYLRAACYESFNMAEWYQPTRILLDFGAIRNNDTSEGWQRAYFNLTQNRQVDNTFLCVGLTRGLSSCIDVYRNYRETIRSKRFKVYMIDDITHLDGDTVTDVAGRPYIADVVYHWINRQPVLYNENSFIDNGYYDYQ